MIRFACLPSACEGFKKTVLDSHGAEAASLAEEIMSEMEGLCEEGCEVALSLSHGCLLVRIYDEGYAFPYPFPLSPDADTEGALNEMSLYMRRELLTPIFTDVPREELDTLGAVFHRIAASVYEDDEDSFFVRAVSECEDFRLDTPVSGERISLSEIFPSDSAALFEIATDTTLNRFWGYDYREDNPEPDADFFLRVVESERERGVAMSFAIRMDGEMIGEAVLFDFDYRGSAQAAIRLRRDRHGLGLGKEALELIIRVSREMGLRSLRAEVLLENEASLAMTRRYFTELGSDGEKAYFTCPLN